MITYIIINTSTSTSKNSSKKLLDSINTEIVKMNNENESLNVSISISVNDDLDKVTNISFDKILHPNLEETIRIRLMIL